MNPLLPKTALALAIFAAFSAQALADAKSELAAKKHQQESAQAHAHAQASEKLLHAQQQSAQEEASSKKKSQDKASSSLKQIGSPESLPQR